MTGSKLFPMLLLTEEPRNLPDEVPTITGGRSKYHVGDEVHVNCTSIRSRPAASLMWYINNKQVRLYLSHLFAYLGHAISHDMTDNDDIIKQTTKLLVVGNTLERKLSYCRREVKMELFRSHCYSIYCNSLWSLFKVGTLNRLKAATKNLVQYTPEQDTDGLETSRLGLRFVVGPRHFPSGELHLNIPNTNFRLQHLPTLTSCLQHL
ncbi:hypothetical protein GWK47_007957 [Chionoecetes opilio]|uniref:CD80-like immunoglobulin C2-set domain-containing protein n=1 Tax=Chionoecetes opilio TaxID=41210 RepID=A0A8J4XYT6_CHIOP|nr:hypothetical protein GWK47_007957 [Chionoecetes opilio]